MAKKTGVSFIVPAFNCADTIETSVNSIVQGNYQPEDEIIIVNDSSTDNTLEILEKLKTKFDRITLISNNKNLGCPLTRNVGIRRAKNSLIFNLDADDLLMSGSVKKLKDYLEYQKADLAAFGEIHFFKDDPKIVNRLWICPSGPLSLADFLSSRVVPGGNYLYRKASWEKVGGYTDFGGKGLHEFWGYSLKQIASGSKFVVLENSYYLHRAGQNSLYVRETKRGINGSLIATKMILPFLPMLAAEDQKYILSSNGKRTWFDNLELHPIKVKSGQKGRSGIIVDSKKSSRLPKIAFSLIKKIRNYQLKLKFRQEFVEFQEKTLDRRFPLSWANIKPILNEKEIYTTFDRHYIYHPAWAARVLAETKPKKHVDLSSTLAFCSQLSAFIPVDFYDIRPAKIQLSNLMTGKANLISLDFKTNSLASLSCMHTLEHIGLGRYGDKLDPNGDLKAIKELIRVLAIGGNLLVVVPIGKPSLLFNAHRIYSYDQIMEYFSILKLIEFTLISDNPKNVGMTYQASKVMADAQNYGCGCFWFKKK